MLMLPWFALTPRAQAASTWRVLADSRPFNSVWMASTTEGWAVATGGGICRTMDGGQTWDMVESGVTATLRGVWGTSMSNVWVVGDDGTILQWNGIAWDAVTSGVSVSLQAIHGNSADNILVVGLNATALRWNGTAWAPENLPNGVNDDLFGVWMAVGGAAVAVGERGRTFRFNGSTWANQNSGAGNNVTFNAVWGSAGNSVWAVGTGGVIRFWNGSNWSAQTSGVTTELMAIQGLDEDEVWVTGRNGTMLLFNGATWSSQDANTNQDLLGVAAVSATSAVAVGNRRASARWNGTSWTASAAILPNVTFPAIWSADDDRVWFGGGNGLILRWNGSSFINTPTGTNRTINAMWGLDHNNLWAVGNNGTILKWDGTAWNAQTSGVTENLNGVWGVSATQIWAVGNTGTLLRWNGTAWSKLNSGVTVNLNAVWARDGSNVWTVGQGGTILKGSSTWTKQTSGVTRNLLSVWGFGTSVWVGGQAGTILKSTGGSWATQTSGVNGAVNAFSGTSATSLWAGAGQTILGGNGTAWEPDGATGIGLPVVGVFALSPAAVFLSTNSGVLLTSLPEQVPQISVEITGGAALNHAEGAVDFGSVEVTANQGVGITIRNTGELDLTGLAISLDGAQASEFTFDPPLPDSLAPASETAITVTFAPLLKGARTANLRIQCNDPTEPSFLIRLTGSAFYHAVEITMPPQPVAAEAGDQVVFTVAATGTELKKYQWRRNGTNIPGATAASLTLDPVAASQSGTYSVVVSNPAGSKTSVGALLIVADAALKTVALPTGATATLTAPVFGTVTGYLWRKGTGPIPADPRYTKWTTKTMRIKDLNESDAAEYACDMTTAGGPLSTRTRLIVYHSKPVILTPGPTPDDPILMPDAIVGGDYAPWPVPIDADELLTPTAFAASGLPSGLKIDKLTGIIHGLPAVALTAPRDYLITLTASNAKGKSTAKAKLTLFPLPENTTGIYSGPVSRLTGFYSGLGGRIDFTVSSTASFSGKLTLGGSVFSFRSVLKAVLGNAKPTAEVRLKRRNLSDLILTFTVDTENHRLEQAKVNDSADMLVGCPLQAWRKRWGTVMPDLEAAALQAFLGRFNGVLLPPEADSNDLPQGNGHLSFVISSSGKVTVSGRLADGTAFTCSTHTGPLGEILCYRALHSNKGSIAGHLLCAAGTAGAVPPFSDSDLSSVSLTWSRPPQNSRAYRTGFDAMTLTAVGGRYLPPANSTPPMERVDDGFTNNATVSFNEGGIEDTFAEPDIPVRLRAAGKVSLPASNPRKTKLSVIPVTGLYSGSFILLDTNPASPGDNVTRNSSFRGIIVRVGGVLRGYGYFLLAKRPAASSNETPTTTNILSGQANLDPL